ncbi:MAG: hypothetical protein JXA04_01300 [Gammaproteobacteria bacterium]|nr:hypothetical protein [Gammaproteobacteria bacterium]
MLTKLIDMKPKTIDGYQKWRQRQTNLPLVELIKEPNCGHDCPAEAPFSCGCIDCAANMGYFTSGEKEQRAKEFNLSEDEIKLWQTLWSKSKGYLTDKGCALPRNMRSLACLKYICGEQQAPRNILLDKK